MTVAQAFQTFKSQLELPDRKQKEAAAAQQELRSRIGQQIHLEGSFLIGSYARQTKIFPLNDIDVMLVRNAQRVGLATSGGLSPQQALDQLAAAARQAYGANARVNMQARSVNVQVHGHGFGFDLIPAWMRSPDGYWIPDASAGSWLPTDPDTHAEIMTKGNERSEGKLKPLIKMAKHWSRNNYDLLRSFHIELICLQIFWSRPIVDFPFGMALFLYRLPEFIGQSMMDPVYGASRVDAQLSTKEQQDLVGRAGYDATNAVSALELEKAGRYMEAIEKWRHAFLRGFPE